MSFASISERFGKELLSENHLEFEAVIKVDFGVERGGACPTCSYIEYPVAVWYRKPDGTKRCFEKTFDYFSEIVRRLDELTDCWDDDE